MSHPSPQHPSPQHPSPGPPFFFSSLPPPFSFCLPSLGGLLVEFWWCFEDRPQMSTFGVLGLSCEFGAAGASHDSPRTPNVNISGPRRFKHHQNSTRREGKKENCGGRGKNEILGGPGERSGRSWRERSGESSGEEWAVLWSGRERSCGGGSGPVGGPVEGRRSCGGEGHMFLGSSPPSPSGRHRSGPRTLHHRGPDPDHLRPELSPHPTTKT